MWKNCLTVKSTAWFPTTHHALRKTKAGNIMEAWGGIAGLQNCMDVMFDEAVQKRGMSLPMFGKLMATNAADIFGSQQKGRIAPGRCRLRLHSAE